MDGKWMRFHSSLLLSSCSRWYNPLNNNDKPAQENEEC